MILGNAIGIPFILPFKNSNSPLIEGLLNFDGIDDDISFSTLPDISGNKTISFNAYFSSLSINGAITLNVRAASSDALYVYLNGTTFSVQCKNGSAGVNSRARLTLSYSFFNVPLFISITKGANEVISVSINGISQSLILDDSYFSISDNSFHIGSERVNYINNTLIWNYNINDEHFYKGYPEGNTDLAWVDTIGSANGVVNGSPTTTNID